MLELIWGSVQEVLWIWIFSFLFSFVKMFQFSFNFKSSVKLSFQQNSRVEFSSSYLTWYNFSGQLLFNFTFISWEASCLFKILMGSARSEWQNLFVGYSFLPLQSGPWIRTKGPNSSSRQIVGGSFLVPYCLRLLLPFPSRPNQVPHWVGLIFS